MARDMTVGDKWSMMFHRTLFVENCITQETAEEAYVLISWAFDRYKAYCKAGGYSLSPKLINLKSSIDHALAAKITTTVPEQRWPHAVFKEWHDLFNKQFYEVITPNERNSDWNQLYLIAKKKYDINIT